MKAVVVLTLLACLCITIHALNPVILVNGLAGSVFRARLHNKTEPSIFCAKTSDWFTIWLNPAEMVPPYHSCFLDNITPRYDAVKDEYYSPEGVELDTNYDFGGIKGLAYLDPDLRLSELAYFGPIVDELVSRLGYEVGKSVRGAPYDWRMGPDGLDEYYDKLKHLIEESYALNGNQRAIIMTHSMGGPISLYFLNQMTDEWKAKYIQAFIPIAGPFGGCSLVLRSMISGYNFGIPIFPHDYFYPIQVNSPSGLFLMPDPRLFGSELLVQTPSKRYSSLDLKQLVLDLGVQTVISFYNRVMAKSVSTLQAPMVDTFPFHASGVVTDVGFKFEQELIPGKANPLPKVISSTDGDGTVPLKSAKVAESWLQTHMAHDFQLLSTTLQNVTHLGLMSDPYTIALVVNRVESILKQA